MPEQTILETNVVLIVGQEQRKRDELYVRRLIKLRQAKMIELAAIEDELAAYGWKPSERKRG
jgi:histidyl-tRNA synthetase